MSTNAAATETALTTVDGGESPKALVIPERDEVLKHFAREASGLPPDEVAAPPDETPEVTAETDALSQSADTAAEVVAEPPAETAEENHLDEDLSAALAADVQEKINRRIGKEVAKTKAEREAREAVEARVTDLEAKLAERSQEPEVRIQNDVPLGHIHDPAKLDAERVKAEQAMEQAEDLLLTLEDTPADVEQALRAAKIALTNEHGEPDFSEARMKKFLRTVKMNADRSLRTAIPAREKFLGAANQFAKEAADFMPELKDNKSPRAKLFAQVVRGMPDLQRNPQWPIEAMVAVLGLERLDEMKATKAKGAAPVPPAKPRKELPVTIPTPKSQPTAPAKGRAQTVDANTTADKMLSGDRAARLNYIRTLLPKS